jgi:DNA adenine methylase
MISGYPSKLYDEALTGWARHTRGVMTRGRSWRTEVLWCNFQPGDDVDRRTPAAGRDWRERDRIKCRVASWAGKFRRMPAYERAAVLNALIAAEQLAARRPPSCSDGESAERCLKR